MRVLTYNQVRFCYTSLKNPCNIILNCCAGRNLITGMLPFSLFLTSFWRLVRVVEGARLESVYTPKGYRGFESLSLRENEA